MSDGQGREWGRWWRFAVAVVLVVLVVVGLWWGGLAERLGGLRSGDRPERVLPERVLAERVLAERVREVLPAAVRERVWPEEVAAGPLVASGSIQAEKVEVASQYGGQVAEMAVAEGETVAGGQLLVQMDTALIDARLQAAEAAVDLAEAALAEAAAGARPGQVAVAEAQLAQAEAAEAAAGEAISSTVALVENPQELLLQIAVARAQLAAGEHDLNQAVAVKDAAEAAKDFFEDVNAEWGNVDRYKALLKEGSVPELPEEIAEELDGVADGTYKVGKYEVNLTDGQYSLYRSVNVNIPLQLHLTPNQWWQAWVGVNAAQARQDGRQATLSHLYEAYNNPQALEAEVNAAVAARAQAEAQVALARAQVNGLRAGPTAAELAALEARVDEAESALASLAVEKEKLRVQAPLAGTVLACLAEPGEVVAAGAPLLALGDLAQVTLTVYVPETELGRVYTGQAVAVSVDAFPERTFRGQVSRIAGSAEYTPRNVATREERVNLVFAVDVALDNEEGLLKPGMAADARFAESGGGQ